MFRFIGACALLCAPLSAQVVNNRVASVTFATQSAGGTSVSFSFGLLTPSQHTVQANVTGSPSGCSIQLEGSLDNTNWFNLSGAQSCTSGSILFSVVTKPITYVRVNVTTLSGGTSPTITPLYVGVQ